MTPEQIEKLYKEACADNSMALECAFQFKKEIARLRALVKRHEEALDIAIRAIKRAPHRAYACSTERGEDCDCWKKDTFAEIEAAKEGNS